jgi:hypothetical protein
MFLMYPALNLLHTFPVNVKKDAQRAPKCRSPAAGHAAGIMLYVFRAAREKENPQQWIVTITTTYNFWPDMKSQYKKCQVSALPNPDASRRQ